MSALKRMRKSIDIGLSNRFEMRLSKELDLSCDKNAPKMGRKRRGSKKLHVHCEDFFIGK
jgi:hypothetical protein